MTPSPYVVYLLALAGFVFQTGEFIPVGLLPLIAEDFGKSMGDAGLLITGYAWTVTVLSLPLVVLAQRCDRRFLLLFLLVIFALGNVLSACALGFEMLLLARMLVASTHALFWPIITPLMVHLAAAGEGQKNLGLLSVGASLAVILGIPLGTLVGQALGWRLTFEGLALLAILLCLWLFFVMPAHASSNTHLFRSLPQLLKNRVLLLIDAVLLLTISGYFTFYSYIAPYLQLWLSLDAHTTAYALLFIGCAGLIAGLLFGRIPARHLLVVIFLSLNALLLALLLIRPLSAGLGLWALLFVFGFCLSVLNMSLKTRLIAEAGSAADLAVAAYSGIFNIGIGAGALFGRTVQHHWDLGALSVVGALLVACAIVLLFVCRHASLRRSFFSFRQGTP